MWSFEKNIQASMSSSKKITFSSGSSSTSGRAHYKSTRTVTDANGNKHTETVEMFDDDAVKVSSSKDSTYEQDDHFFYT